MSSPYRDYTFEEWRTLSTDEQWRVCVHFWNLFPPAQGRTTRNAIIRAFLSLHPELKCADAVGFGWRGHLVECIFVVLEDPAIPVPAMFCNFPVTRGLLHSKLVGEEWVVDW